MGACSPRCCGLGAMQASPLAAGTSGGWHLVCLAELARNSSTHFRDFHHRRGALHGACTTCMCPSFGGAHARVGSGRPSALKHWFRKGCQEVFGLHKRQGAMVSGHANDGLMMLCRCPGRQFAEAEIGVVVAFLLTNFDICLQQPGGHIWAQQWGHASRAQAVSVLQHNMRDDQRMQ